MVTKDITTWQPEPVEIHAVYKGVKRVGYLDGNPGSDGVLRLNFEVYEKGSGKVLAIAVDSRNLLEISKMLERAAGQATHLELVL